MRITDDTQKLIQESEILSQSGGIYFPLRYVLKALLFIVFMGLGLFFLMLIINLIKGISLLDTVMKIMSGFVS